MEVGAQFNSRSPAVKRLMREAWEMRESTEDFSATPVADNLFEWHFTIRGANDSDFEGGVYHGRISFPTEYPMKPPNIILLTPNGRFEINKKICLSISGHHPETWQPSWCVRTALLALIAFMPTPGNSTVGALDYTKEERQVLARKSRSWECPDCGNILKLLATVDRNDNSSCKDKNFVHETDCESTKNLVPDVTPSSPNDSETLASFASSETIPDESESIGPKLNVDNSSPKVPENITSADSLNTPTANNVSIPRFNHYSLFEVISSNFSSSRVTVSVIIVLIALILYRRLFLLN